MDKFEYVMNRTAELMIYTFIMGVCFVIVTSVDTILQGVGI